jgi:hypothetical protein
VQEVFLQHRTSENPRSFLGFHNKLACVCPTVFLAQTVKGTRDPVFGTERFWSKQQWQTLQFYPSFDERSVSGHPGRIALTLSSRLFLPPGSPDRPPKPESGPTGHSPSPRGQQWRARVSLLHSPHLNGSQMPDFTGILVSRQKDVSQTDSWPQNTKCQKYRAVQTSCSQGGRGGRGGYNSSPTLKRPHVLRHLESFQDCMGKLGSPHLSPRSVMTQCHHRKRTARPLVYTFGCSPRKGEDRQR